MASITCRFFSEVLEMGMTIQVIIPEANRVPESLRAQVAQGDLPVLYLLHGLSDDESAWTRYSSIERYANEMGMAVVMPTVHRSFYTDLPTGQNYFTYVAEEVPRVARHMFPITGDPKKTFVAGLSMGGYGAFKLALTHPERFGAAASLSGYLDLTQRLADNTLHRAFQDVFSGVFGPGPWDGTKHDLFHLLEQAVQSGRAVPRLFQTCGVSDFLYPGNVRFRDHVGQFQGLDFTYGDGPGDHNWDYWDAQIRLAMHWMLK